MTTFIQEIDNFGPSSATESVYNTLLGEYERVVMKSLITSFGLDFIVKDQHGGDVDTIHNVRKIGMDDKMKYKNSANEKAYNSREAYDTSVYHGDRRFSQKKSDARRNYNEYGTKIRDAYTNQELEYTKASSVPKELRVELDHVVECKAINDDRGRVLSGISGVDLANQESNLAWTNKSLNASMGAWARGVNDRYKKEHGCDAPMEMVNMEAYIAAHPNIDEQTANNMRVQYLRSKNAYDQRINSAYYTSSSFVTATARATAKVGFKMGIKQAIGLILSEIWFEVRNEFKHTKDTTQNLVTNLANAFKRGLENSKTRYKEIWREFISGSVAGVLASLTTTISNIFFTTAKKTVTIIRHSWASLVEAVKILFINPDCLPVGEKFRAAAKIIAAGASVVAGAMIGEVVKATGVGSIPIIGDVVSTFISSLITGVMSCTLLYALDHSSAINDIVGIVNKIPSVNNCVVYFKQQGALLDEYAAKLARIDIDKFQKETNLYNQALDQLEYVSNPKRMNEILRDIYFNKLQFKSPYGTYDCIDDFMNDRSAVLTFS